jgi:hypothetical protein
MSFELFAHHFAENADREGWPEAGVEVGLVPLLALVLALTAYVATMRFWLNKLVLDASDAIAAERAKSTVDTARINALADRRRNGSWQIYFLHVVEGCLAVAGIAVLWRVTKRWAPLVTWDGDRPFDAIAIGATFIWLAVATLVLLWALMLIAQTRERWNAEITSNNETTSVSAEPLLRIESEVVIPAGHVAVITLRPVGTADNKSS